jgi:formylglycine-generating enzyme required for sulfatase activity
VLTGLGSLAPDRVARFLREAEVASRLDHPGIATVYEAGTEDGVPYIAMRYVEGETLATRIAASQGTLLETARIIESVARALDAAHRKGVIHRDVKPRNIVVTSDDEPVILDFGLAHAADVDAVSITRTGDHFGTPAYMSPEQIGSENGRPDARTDVWSLGVTLYECLTFRRPFEAPTREGLYQQILTKDPPAARTVNPGIPRDLEIVLQTALEKDVDRRYQTALDLAEELRRVRLHEPILARPAGRVVRLQRWAQRNPMLAMAVGGVFLVLAIGLAVALFLLAQRDRALWEVTKERDAKNEALVQVTTERNEKQAALSDYDRLGDFSRLERLIAEADDLWPCEPSKVPEMRAWVEQASALARRLDAHQALLEALRKSGRRALPESRPGPSGSADSRPGWLFASDADQFRHDTTMKLVADLTAFVDPDPAQGLIADMRDRLAFAESVERETLEKYAREWAEAIRSIAQTSECPKYRGLRIKPQLGLIPIGRDPSSGFWEFVHLQTVAPGADPIPKRGPDGRLLVTDGMGVVLVLLPGGIFSMGAVKPGEEQSAEEPNVDPDAEAREGPVTDVALDPFFISKYEFTQGQWLRLVGRNPSGYGPGVGDGENTVVLGNPVEQVSWDDCDRWLTRVGFVLPTEAQWEYAARGGTTTPRWTGLVRESLKSAENLADHFAKVNGRLDNLKIEPWNDGHAVHARIGSFVPNPFGLHDVLGNVREWCRDWYGAYDVKPRHGDGLRAPPGSINRVYRGASYYNEAWFARSTFRHFNRPGFRTFTHGVRPARQCSRD